MKTRPGVDSVRARRIQGDGGTLGARRQIKYLVRTPAPRGDSYRSVDRRKFSDRVRCVREVACMCVVFLQFFTL